MKKFKKAAALRYEEGYDAPKLIAKGKGYVADKILEKAKSSSVPIVYNKELSDLLCNIDVGDMIPPELYEAVANVIAYIIKVDSNKK